MPENDNAFQAALSLILSLDPVLLGIVTLSLQVSLSAVLVGALIGLPLGAALALWHFPGRGLAVTLLNAFMGLPPVVAGLMIYLLLSRAGPLGSLGLLFTPTAMIIAQTLLVLPIIAALTRDHIGALWEEYREQLHSLRIGRVRAMPGLLWDARFALMTVILAGFGRASAEVGAVLIVGGNIDGVTRVMTTAIALETSKGNLALALGLGLVLLGLVALVNGTAYVIGERARRRLG
ncbi:ABC transporter permease [Billgrantia endophytica]|uniref:ABC transporter permease n=1 Tax=Billgrantia endophytica TaxID=2033802 RepID=A0A2N7TWM2_9GAMM|nr:ABC transporter permease [Halomonas endophytica]PMR72587.1 ABC transporter permease [Halomonas endophytica]